MNIIPFIITFISGISTLLGIIPTYFNLKYKDKIINISLGISAGVMLSVSIFSLIKEALNYYYSTITIPTLLIVLIFIVIGLLISEYINKISKTFSSSPLYRIGLVSMIVLVLHNIPEGIITYLTSEDNLNLGFTLAFAIALHNIPEGIAIAVPIYFSTNNRKKAIIYTSISGFSEFLGAIISYLFIREYITQFILGSILSITAGIMIHISLFELIPSAYKYNKKLTQVSTSVGILIMLVSIFIFKL